jgi:adenylosuccinate synthase
VRWAGGANAGHTLVVDGKKYVTHLIPSGILRKGLTCVLGEGMVVDPGVLLDEIRTFRGHGFLAADEDLIVAERAHLTMPYHKEIDRLREDGPAGSKVKIGTTKRGIGPTYESKSARLGIRVGDLLRPQRFRELLDRTLAEAGPTLERLGGKRPDAAEIAEQYLAYGAELRPFIRDASRFVSDAIRAGKSVMFEGAQGVLLDVDHGTYPFVTSSSTTAGGACAACGIGPTKIDAVMGIAKAYATRVGAGPFPTELHDATGQALREKGQEFGSTTGRPRRCGWLDLPALRLTIRLSGIEGLGLTKLDVLAGLPTVKICTGYRVGGRIVDEMPLDADDLATAEPVYEEMPGWSDDEAVPPAAARFVERVSALCGIPVWATSFGPARAQTIVAKNPFDGV